MKLLWSTILNKTGGRVDCINSTHVNQYWKELCMNKKYSNICKFRNEKDIMAKIEDSLNKYSIEKKHKQMNSKKQSKEIKQNVNNSINFIYPSPTLWNSHCFTVFTDNGAELYAAIQDPEIQQIAWKKYGFRTGVVSSDLDTSFITGVPKELTNLASSLKMSYYDKTKTYLKEHNQ